MAVGGDRVPLVFQNPHFYGGARWKSQCPFYVGSPPRPEDETNSSPAKGRLGQGGTLLWHQNWGGRSWSSASDLHFFLPITDLFELEKLPVPKVRQQKAPIFINIYTAYLLVLPLPMIWHMFLVTFGTIQLAMLHLALYIFGTLIYIILWHSLLSYDINILYNSKKFYTLLWHF